MNRSYFVILSHMKTNQLILGIIAIAILVGIAFLVFPLFPEQKPE
ncbi:MAG: hypothetical protein ACD_78C00320G0019, partial [uncultured bacterium (gcode 4)]